MNAQTNKYSCLKDQMNAQTNKPTLQEDHANVHVALAAAQAEMAAPAKNAENPAFKRGNAPSKYADLDSVVESVRGPLTRHGISWRHEMQHMATTASGDGWMMTTYLDHGASGTSIYCPVPLFIDRNSMHGLKSAITYAKRIGLESVTGQAPGDDDDGNAASANPPKRQERDDTEAIEIAITSISNAAPMSALHAIWADLPPFVKRHAHVIAAKNARKAELEQPTDEHPPLDDELPKDLL